MEKLEKAETTNFEHWSFTPEGIDTLKNYSEEEKSIINRISETLGFVPTHILLDVSKGEELIKREPLIEQIVKQTPLTEDMVDLLVCSAELSNDLETQIKILDGEIKLEMLIERIFSHQKTEGERDIRVGPILEKLENELAIYEDQFKDKEIVGLLFGSFFFGDPSDNPDLDFDFVVADENNKPEELSDINNELPEFIGLPMHTATLNLEKMNLVLDKVLSENYEGIDDEYIMNVNILITSKVIDLPAAKQNEILEKIRNFKGRVLDIATKNAFIRLLLTDPIEGQIIKIRTKRAAGDKNYH